MEVIKVGRHACVQGFAFLLVLGIGGPVSAEMQEPSSFLMAASGTGSEADGPCAAEKGKITDAVNCSDYSVLASPGDPATNGQTCSGGLKCNDTGLKMKCPSAASGPFKCKTVIIDRNNTCDCRCQQ